MSGIADHVPYSEKQLQALAKVLSIDTALFWMNPVSGRLELRESYYQQRNSVSPQEQADLD